LSIGHDDKDDASGSLRNGHRPQPSIEVNNAPTVDSQGFDALGTDEVTV
jgi:hypothetical protein